MDLGMICWLSRTVKELAGLSPSEPLGEAVAALIASQQGDDFTAHDAVRILAKNFDRQFDVGQLGDAMEGSAQ